MSRVTRYLDNGDAGRLRVRVQIFCFAVLVYGGYLALNLGDQLPTFACVFVEPRGGSCYLLGLQHQLAAPWSRLFSASGLRVLIGLLTFTAFLLVFNKAWCGWVCPLGTLQDWLTALRRRLGVRDSRYAGTTFRRLGKVKYVLLGLLVLLPLGMGNSLFGLPRLGHDFATPFCMICPGRTLLPACAGDCSQLVVDFSSRTRMVLSSLGMMVTGAFAGGSFLKKRFFCLFCPMSAFHFLLHKAGLLRLTKQGARCTRCGNCTLACDMGITAIADDLTSRNIVTDDCMMCLKCVSVCPEEGCLQATWLGLPVYTATEEGFFRRSGERNDHDA